MKKQDLLGKKFQKKKRDSFVNLIQILEKVKQKSHNEIVND